MSKESDVIEQISETLGIDRGRKEEETLWKARVIYSAAGRMALASLWDVAEDEQSISITHFKRRAAREIEALASSNVNLMEIFNDEIDAITNEIYEIYLNTGYMYHTSNHIEPIPEVIASAGKKYLVRGCALKEEVYITGLGLYSETKLKNKYTMVENANELFQIPQMDLKNYLEKLLSYAEWKVLSVNDDTEYLRTEPPFTGGYWCREPDLTGMVSLLRMGQPGRYIYFLYKYLGEYVMASPLAQWMTDNHEYYSVAGSLLAKRNVLPLTSYWNDGAITHFNIGYLYPPKIQNFIKLYSWPESMIHFPSNFRRVMKKELFDICRMIIEPLGYGFIER